MELKFSGKVIAVLEPRGGVSKKGTNWKVQEYVIESNEEKYPRRMCFQVFGDDKIAEFAIKEGEDITVCFDIDAQEYNGRWYNQMKAWKIERGQQTQPSAVASSATPQLTPEQAQKVQNAQQIFDQVSEDKLPF